MTALRSLLIELGLADGVSNRLRGIDSQIDGIESGAIRTQGGFDDLGRATTEYGRVAGQEIEGVGKDVTELDKQVKGHADTTAKAAESAEKSWAKIGAAIGGAALAAEAFVRSQQGYYVTAAKISHITGIERDEVVGLAVELTNISNSIDDAYGVMEVGARQGLRTRDELVAYVQVWDDIGTASDENAVELARAAISLRSVGIETGDLTDTYDTFGFVMTHTTSSVSDFLRLTGYMARDMDQYGMGVSDVAVTLAALEEKGMGAADAKRALRSAMSSAKGDVTALYRELGITDEQLTRLNDEVKGGADYITEMGDAYNESRSPLQYLQIEATKLSNLLGADMNPVIGVASAALSGLSTALLTAATAKFVFADASIKTLIPSLAASTASAWAFTAALLANPITWIVLGIVGLGAALYLLATRWDDISGWFMGRWDATAGVVTGAMDWIGRVWDATVGSIVAGAEWLGEHLQIIGLLFPVTAPIAGMNLLRDNWDTVTGAIAGGWDWLVGAAQDGAAWLAETIGGGLSGISDLFWQYHPLGIVIRQWDEITGYLKGIDLVETGRDILLGLVSGILDVRQQAIDAVMGIGEGILNAVTGFFGISSPSRLMQEMGAAVGEGFAIGVDGSMPDRIPLPDAIAGEVHPGTVPGGYAAAWTEPAVGPLAGQITYAPAITEPAIGSLTGAITYLATIIEPAIPTLTGEAVYASVLNEPSIRDLAGAVTYHATVAEPGISALAGEARYTSVVNEPMVADLTGAITYLATVMEPMVSPLAGTVTYRACLAEPTVRDVAGTVAYRATMDEPTIADLAGEAIYTSVLTEPTIADLTGSATYLSQIAPVRVPDLHGTAAYDTAITEPMVADLTGSITYLSTVLEPSVERLTGTVEYTGVLMDPPDVMSRGSQYGVRLPDIEDGVLYSGPVMDYREVYTPERDAPTMAGSTAMTFAPSTTINVTTGSGDAREIATAVDRRLRQTFDRHAELYFARQRRRAAL